MHHHNTPNRKCSDSSLFMEPIFFETPRIRKFYEKNSDLSDEKPHHQGHMIFTLMSSPADPHSMAKRNMLMRKTMDIFSEGIEYPRNYDKQEEEHNTTPRDYIRQRDTTAHTVSYRTIDHESDKSTTICSQLIANFDTVEVSEHNDEDREQVDKQSEEIFKFGRVDKENEVRKRKRKSTQQLKILKVEFEKDDAWDKEKIMNVAKITGLTESQVYKWCWDQKKKNDTITIDKLKFDIFDDKENISPKGSSSLLPRSKNISKMKKGKPFNPLRVTQKLKLSNWDEECDDTFDEEYRGPLHIQF